MTSAHDALRPPGIPDKGQAVELLHAMVGIPSPSCAEAELAAYLAEWMERAGLAARLDEAGNVIGELVGGPGPHVMLLGHLDTVPGEMPLRREGGRLWGRGAVDAKGPLAAMIMAAAGRRDFRGRVTVIGVVEEETPRSRGAVAIARTLDPPDVLVVGEPSGWSSIVLGYKGRLNLTYRVSRPATHPSNPVEKASEAAVEFWTDLRRLLGPQSANGSFNDTTVTLSAVHGDGEHAELDLDCRTPVGFDRDAFIAALEEHRRGGGVEVVNGVEAVLVSRGNPVVRALSAGIRRQQGKPRHVVKTATSDMNTLAESWDIPMATYGPGDSALDHSDKEHIVLDEYLRGIAVLRQALDELEGDR